MDDVRVQWLGERLRGALGVRETEPFEELVNRNDGEEAETVLHFLNQGAVDDEGVASALFFRQELRLEEIDVEIGAAQPRRDHNEQRCL